MPVTLSINATSIRLLSVKAGRVKEWGEARLEPGLVRDGLILEPKTVGAAIDALFESTKTSKERVVTSLTGLPFTYRILSLPRMKPALVEEAILRGARQEIPLPLEELYLSWQATGSRHNEVDFFVLGVSRNLIDAIVETLQEAGVKPYIIDLKPLALARAANRVDVLVVALEPDCFDVVLVASGIPAIMHSITPRQGASIEDDVRRLTDELSKIVSFYNSSHPEDPLSLATPLLLTGELSADAATGRLIQSEVEYPVEFLVPPLKCPPDLPVALYATNMGLALKGVAEKTTAKGDVVRFYDINLNVLSGKYRTEVRPVPLRHILLTLAAVAAVGLLFFMYQVRSQAGAETMQLQTELSRAGQELHQDLRASNEARQVEDTINEIEADVNALKQEHRDILSERGYFTDALRLVTGALPARAYFTSMEIGADEIIVEGRADSSLAVINYVMALETQGVFSEVRIAELDDSAHTGGETMGGGSTGVSFTIVISRQVFEEITTDELESGFAYQAGGGR